MEAVRTNEYLNPAWVEDPLWARIPSRTRDELQGFAAWLQTEQTLPDGERREPYSDQTTYAYLSAVRRALTRDDLLDTLREARSQASRAAIKYALLAWAEYRRGDQRGVIEERIVEWESTRVNRKRGGRRPKPVVRGLSNRDWVRLRARADQDHDAAGLVLRVMLRTGLRIGDVLRIRRSAALEGIRTGEMALILKGGKQVAYPTSPLLAQLEALAKMRRWSSIQDLLGGSRWAAYARVRRRLRRYGRELEIDGVRLHRLRHTVLSAVADSAGVRMASALAVHSDVRTTERYIRRPPATDKLADALARTLERSEAEVFSENKVS